MNPQGAHSRDGMENQTCPFFTGPLSKLFPQLLGIAEESNVVFKKKKNIHEFYKQKRSNFSSSPSVFPRLTCTQRGKN